MNQKDQEESSLNRADRISNTQTQIRSLRATLFAYLSKYCEMQSPRWSSPEQRFRWSSSCSAQRTLSPHPWAQRGDASGQTCCRRALWRCWSLHGLVAPATTARRSRRSDAWRYRRQEGLPQHRGNIWQSENTHIQGWVGGRGLLFAVDSRVLYNMRYLRWRDRPIPFLASSVPNLSFNRLSIDLWHTKRDYFIQRALKNQMHVKNAVSLREIVFHQ